MDTTHIIPWLAGLLEGEGYFGKGYKTRPSQAAISVEMSDEDVVRKLAEIWGVKYCACKIRNPKWKQTYRAQIRGASAMEWMIKIRPYMGLRRGAKIDEILKLYMGTRSTTVE